MTVAASGIDPRWPHGKAGPYVEPHPQVISGERRDFTTTRHDHLRIVRETVAAREREESERAA